MDGSLSTTPDPSGSILALFHEWDQARLAADQFEDDDDLRVAREHVSALESEILSIPVNTAPELAAKILAYTEFGGFQLPKRSHHLWDELRQLVGEV